MCMKLVELYNYESNLQGLKDIAIKRGATITKIVSTRDLVFDCRSRFMCRSCKRYGKKATCPPYLPEVSYFQTLVEQYQLGLLVGVKCQLKGLNREEIRMESSLSLHKILLELERQAFEMGHYFVISFIGGSCKWCSTDTCKFPCSNPTKGRFPLEAIGIDVIETCKRLDIRLRFPVDDHLWRIGLILVG